MVAFKKTDTLPKVLKLTDSLYGESKLIPTNEFYHHVQVTDQGLVFEGKQLGTKHIHIAYYAEE